MKPFEFHRNGTGYSLFQEGRVIVEGLSINEARDLTDLLNASHDAAASALFPPTRQNVRQSSSLSSLVGYPRTRSAA
ncbi:MAG: hypothetical protein HQL52_16565 [Magnetococcales bacterium]|nr:hypothetical protein [Magnetococcales bacterium]